MSGLRLRLWNWGRWGRDRAGPPRIAAPILWQMIYDKGDDEYNGAVDAILPPIDVRDAEELDPVIRKIAYDHFRVVSLHFYKLKPQGDLDLGAAERALQDVIDAVPIAIRWRKDVIEAGR